jgi:hypothetical protein
MNARTLTAAAPATIKDVQPLLTRGTWYVAQTATLAGYIGSLLVREQFKHFDNETIEWSMAMFNVTPVAGGPAPKSIHDFAEQVAADLEKHFGEDDVLELKAVIKIVHDSLLRVYGHQLRVTGWLPGYRVAEGRRVLELSGQPCPECTVNPTGYVVGDRRNIARCLNSEDCGWHA